MAYDEQIADRIRRALVNHPIVEEKKMFQGLCFMVNDKMCICVGSKGVLCRIGAKQVAIELEKDHCRQMVNNGRIMKNFVYVDDMLMQSDEKLHYWLTLCLQFNEEAKPSKRKKER